MFAVIFEVFPKPERFEEYLAIAGTLRPELERIEGFLDNERFASRTRRGWLLSLSLWRDEKALIRWRTEARHHLAQEAGRNRIFADYHLRVGEIAADSTLAAGERVAEQRRDETEAGEARCIQLSQADFPDLAAEADAAAIRRRFGAPTDQSSASGLVQWDTFESITRPRHFLLLEAFRTAAEAEAAPRPAAASVRRRAVRVIRDYGLAERREAPQYYPPVVSATYGSGSGGE